MIRVYYFICGAGHSTEHFIDTDARVVSCKCGEPALRAVPAPRARLEGITGDFPSAAAKWERNRESHMAREKKYMESNGEILPGQQVRD